MKWRSAMAVSGSIRPVLGTPDPRTNEVRGDVIWQAIRQEAAEQAAREPTLAGYFDAAVLDHDTLEGALSSHLAPKLASPRLGEGALRELLLTAFTSGRDIGVRCRRDLQAVLARDPACRGYFVALLFYKGFHALQCYRAAHYYWTQGRETLAMLLQSQLAQALSVDIHPAARLASGILIDHGTGVVIGETAVVDDDVSILHEVTLGGTGKSSGDRHPKVRSGVLIGAGAKILGNIEIGEGARVGAGSVVLNPVPAHCTVAGVPARVVKGVRSEAPALEMDQWIPTWDI